LVFIGNGLVTQDLKFDATNAGSGRMLAQAILRNIMKLLLGTLLLFPLSAWAGTLKLDKSASRIQVDAKATGHSFTGTLADFTATIRGDQATLTPTGVDLSWKFTDLKTQDDKRDKEMLKWLGGGTPTGSFTFTKTWTDKGTTYAMGKLKIHGVSKSIGFPYSAKKEGGKVTIDGTATFSYQDFDLPIIRAMAVMTVNPKLTVSFHLVGEAQ
jgi:polyisoprenoid-binding protein YceI